ncbi:MAG: c-type cytochrome [Cyanobacteria bacterium J06623_5]
MRTLKNCSQWLMLTVCTLFFWCALSTLMPVCLAAPPALSPPTDHSAAATLFERNCAACHANGGNIIRRGKNLRHKAMARNGYDNVDAIAQIITQGKGNMSAYGERLSEEEIRAIAQYVHARSESGW